MTPQRAWRADIALALVLVAALSMACTGNTSPAAPAAPAIPAADGPVTPKVNRVVIAFKQLGAEAPTPRSIAGFDVYPFRATHEVLIGNDPKTGEPNVPQLATEWTLAPDAKSLNFKLRKGVQFQKGWGEMKAQDVVFTWDSLIKIKEPPSHVWAETWWNKYITAIDVNNDYDITMRIVPQAQFWLNLSSSFHQLAVRSKAQHEKEGEPKNVEAGQAPGTGPYQWKEQKAASYLRLERVPFKHWRTNPDFPELEFRWMNEASSKMAALVAGEVHITDLPGDLQPAAEKAGMKRLQNQGYSPRVMGTFRCCYYDPATKQWPLYPDDALMNVKVREALNRAINRDELGKAFAPRRSPVYVTHYSSQRLGWDPSWETRFPDKYGFNPDRAKSLLAESGYTAAKPLEITVIPAQLTYIANGPDIADAVAAYFRAVGVKVNYQNLDPATETAQSRAYKLRDVVRLQSTSSSILDGMITWNLNYTTAGNGFYNPDVVAMSQAVNNEMAPNKQAPLLKALGEWAFNNYWDIPLWWVPQEVMVNPKIVQDWTWPAAGSGGWSDFDTIRAAK